MLSDLVNALQTRFGLNPNDNRNIVQKYGWYIVFVFVTVYYLREHGKVIGIYDCHLLVQCSIHATILINTDGYGIHFLQF